MLVSNMFSLNVYPEDMMRFDSYVSSVLKPPTRSTVFCIQSGWEGAINGTNCSREQHGNVRYFFPTGGNRKHSQSDSSYIDQGDKYLHAECKLIFKSQ